MVVVAKLQHSENEVRCLLTVTKHTVHRHANELVHIMHPYLYVHIVIECVLFATIYNYLQVASMYCSISVEHL